VNYFQNKFGSVKTICIFTSTNKQTKTLMKKFLLLLVLAVFTANLSAESLNVKTATEQTDRSPKHKKKKHKKSRKAKKHAKKKGLVGRGCRGLNAMPGRR